MKYVFHSLCIAFLFTFLPLFSQQSGTVNLENLGMTFEIPSGWVGQFAGEGFMMGSYTEPGFIYLSTHQTSTLTGLKADAQRGLNDPASGIFLNLAGSLAEWQGRGVEGTFSGTLSGQSVKAHLLGLINPKGMGILIMAATDPGSYSHRYPQLAREVAQSFVFSQPTASQPSHPASGPTDWSYLLGGTRLTYMNSYNSIDYSNPNYTTGGGYSEKEVIDLCKAGYFNYSSSSFTSISGGPAVSGNQMSRGKGAGNWEIGDDGQGQAILRLSFYSGERYEYVLSYPNKKMHLNGKRYYHTWTGENAPVCY